MAFVSDSEADADLFKAGRVVSRSYLFTQESFAAFADMGGDPKPLHDDAEFTVRSRLGNFIASEAHSTGVFVSVITDKFAKNGEAVGLGFSFIFRRGVKAGAEIDLVWTITSRDRSEKLNGIVVEFNGQIRDQRTGQVYVRREGCGLLIGEAEIEAVAKQPSETRPS